MQKFDIGIIGAGVSGVFAALRIAEKHKSTRAILFELGKGPGKRRRFLEGWLGCFPQGDGKIYTNDIDKFINKKQAVPASKWVFNQLNEVNESKLIKSKSPIASTQAKIKELGFDLEVKNYYQWEPESIHQLSKVVAEKIEAIGNVELSFDNEVFNIVKRGNVFVVSSAEGEYTCKKIILCAGKSGWRWINALYKNLELLDNDNVAMFGIRAEIGTQYLKDFNKSHCTLTRNDLQIGPICWNGSVIQEDHADLTISGFRSNEDRWKTDKAFFSIIGLRKFENATMQTDRLAKLAFLLGNDRVAREKIKPFTKLQSQLNLIPEYAWLNDSIKEIEKIIPAIISRGYFHYPDIITMTSKIKLKPTFESEILDGFFVVGESASVYGICGAAVSAVIAVENIIK